MVSGRVSFLEYRSAGSRLDFAVPKLRRESKVRREASEMRNEDDQRTRDERKEIERAGEGIKA